MKIELNLEDGRELSVAYDFTSVNVVMTDGNKGWRIPFRRNEAEQLYYALKFLLGH